MIGANIPTRDDCIRACEAASRSRVSPEILNALGEIQTPLPASTRRTANLEALSKEGTVAVVTGQQVGLFLGPLFTLYKAISALRVARELEAATNRRVVPIFWLQTEDHDFPEINRTHFPAPSGEILTITVGTEGTLPERVPVSLRRLSPQVNEAVNELRSQYLPFPFADRYLQSIEESYRRGASFAEAFARLLSAFLPDSGLLFFDPRHPAVSRAARPIFQRALRDTDRITDLLQTETARLLPEVREAPVHIRAHSPLFFFHTTSGERFRLERENGVFRLVGSDASLTYPEISKLIDEHPERFSTSALLRPILQDALLPTAVYVAGEAEARYHQQIRPLYDLFGLNPHPVLPRLGFLTVDEKSKKLLEQLHLQPSDLALPDEQVFEKAASTLESGILSPQEVEDKTLAALEEPFSALRASFERVDKTLVESLGKTEEKIAGLVQALKHRYIKALSLRDQVAEGRIARLRAFLYPEGVEQERFFSPLYFLFLYGEEFLKRIADEGDVFHPTKTEIYL